jgi:group I intron endonuclease
MICGIYKIVNKVNGKCYIGSSNNIFNRWRYHKRLLKENRHDNGHLQTSWNKYGSDEFEFSIIEETLKDKLLEREQKYLDICKVNPTLYYNIAYDALSPMKNKIPWNKGKVGVQVSWNKGLSFSEETKEKMSKSAKLRTGNKNSMFGKTHSNETKQKMVLAWKTRNPVSEEPKLKMSISQKKRFNKPI